MESDIFGNMGVKKIVTIVPPMIGVLIVLIVSLLYPDPGVIGITVLFSLMLSISPYATWKYFRVKRIKAMENQFPNFLRDLVEAKKSGMTLSQALKDASKNEYGMLNEEVKKMSNQLSWNMSFDEVMTGFSKRNNESDLITRTVRILMEAKKSGGNIVSAMETLSSDVSTVIEIEEERKSEMMQHAAVMYLIYFMFVAITVVLSKVLVPMTTEMDMGGGGGLGMGIGLGDGGGICTPPMPFSEDFVCSFFESFAMAFGLGVEGGLYYEGLFVSMVIVQGIFSGLIIGQIRNNSAASGFKHSVIITGVGLVAYILASRYVPMEIM